MFSRKQKLPIDIAQPNVEIPLRKITSEEHNHLVLCDHPRIKKGVARALAKKHKGPFIIKQKRENGVDYLIQRVERSEVKRTRFTKIG